MGNLTLTVNLDSLTPTQLAALHVVALAGVKIASDRETAHATIMRAGKVTCGNDYYQTYHEIDNFLNGKGA